MELIILNYKIFLFIYIFLDCFEKYNGENNFRYVWGGWLVNLYVIV